jgi:uncharacterized repeat protein (TIGR02543 family)
MKKRILALIIVWAVIVGVLPVVAEESGDSATPPTGFTITFIDPTGDNETVVLTTDEDGRISNPPVFISSDGLRYARCWRASLGDELDVVWHSELVRGIVAFGEDVTLYAEYLGHDNFRFIAAVLDPNGGFVPYNIAEWMAEDGSYTMTLTLPTPTRPGYTFAGWFTEKDGGTRVTGDDGWSYLNPSPAHQQNRALFTLYAQWIDNAMTTTVTTPPPPEPAPTIECALDILMQLAGLENTAPPNSTIEDVLEILMFLAGLPSRFGNN